ncbi:hypothetical protein ACQP3J_33255, partial [Escherichia coli]
RYVIGLSISWKNKKQTKNPGRAFVVPTFQQGKLRLRDVQVACLSPGNQETVTHFLNLLNIFSK